MSRRFILTFATVAALASTALVVFPAFANGGHNASLKMRASHHSSLKSAGLGHQKPGKALAGHGKMDGSTGKSGNGPGELANGPGKLGTGPNSLAGQKLASVNSGKTMGPGPGKVFADNTGPSNTMPQNQTGQANGGSSTPKSPKDVIKQQWIDSFVQNLMWNSYTPKSPGTVFSLCLNLASCAAGMPPTVIKVLAAPLASNTSNTFDAAVKAFTPTDPNDPLSSPADTLIKKAITNPINPYNPFSSPDWPQTGPAANPGQ